MISALRAVTPAPIRAATRQYRLDRALVRHLFDDRDELDAYRAELQPLWPVIDNAHQSWLEETDGIVGGHPVSFAQLSPLSSERLYAIIRKLQPEVLVETGVCNGVSSAVILQALVANGRGRLLSVDLPSFADESSAQGWEAERPTGKVAVVRSGHDPGWLIPEQLRARWELTIGRSQDVLPQLLERLGQIDFFMHDSEHTYECTQFEMTLAAQHLSPGAPLVVDDANWNGAFAAFVRARQLHQWDLDGGTYMTLMPFQATA